MPRKYKTRKTYKKKKVYRKKRFNRKFKRYRSVGSKYQMLRIKRTFDFATPSGYHPGGGAPPTYGVVPYFAVGSGSGTLYSYNSACYGFKVSDIPNISDYGQLYDSYKLSYVKLTFTYLTCTQSQNLPDLGVGVNPQNQIMAIAVWTDFDDSSAPATNSSAWIDLQKSNRAKFHTFPNQRRNSFSVKLRPRLMEGIYDSTGALQASRISKSGWIDGATTNDVLFRGVKVMAQVPPTDTELYGVIHTFKITATYYVTFKMLQGA